MLLESGAFQWLVGIIITIIVAWLFGEKAAVRYEKKREKEERFAAHQSLLNQVRLIEKLAQCNIKRSEAPRSYDSLIRLPVAAFETAFVSEKPVLSNHPDLLQMVNSYLSEAYAVNAAIDAYLSLKSGPANQFGQEFVKETGEGCRRIIGILSSLDDNIKESMAGL
jgi:hypothetical protein